MRFLDIGVAALIGVASIAVMSFWTTGQVDRSSLHPMETIKLRNGLLWILGKFGVYYFQVSTTGTICASLAGLSNGTVTFNAMIGAEQCNASPPSGSLEANITLQNSAGTLVLQAWSNV